MAIIQVIPEGDLALENGDLVLIDGTRQIRQAIQCRFRMFLGEWFLDTREGVPYYQEILVKNPDPQIVRSVFRRVLTETPGVDAIETFEVIPDWINRILRFRFVVQTDAGTVSVAPSDDSFVVRF